MSTNITKSKRIAIKDEGVVKTSDVNSIDFTGTGVTATNVGNDVTVNITGGGVTQIVAGTNVTISPAGGTGVVTVNAAGGGGGAAHILIKPVSGRLYNAKKSTTFGSVGNNLLANSIRFNPFLPANSLTISNLQININTAAVGSLARILIYSDLNGAPNSKLLESTSLDCSTTGTKTFTTSFTFTAGTTYWLGCYCNITIPNIMQYQAAEQTVICANSFESSFGCLTAAETFPNAPSTLSTSALSTTTGIIINFQAT